MLPLISVLAVLVEHSHVMELIKGVPMLGVANDDNGTPRSPSDGLVRWHDGRQETV